MEWENLHYLKSLQVWSNTIGSITKIPHLVIHYLPQQPDMQAGNTVLQQVFLGASEDIVK